MTISTPTSSSMDHSSAIETGMPTVESPRSNNIPLPLWHKHRTQSEIQLCEDMETAEQRDFNMFYRLVNGIRERQMNLVRENESSSAAAAFYNPAHALTEAERSLAHIIHTRNAPVDKRNGKSTATSCKMNIGRRENANAFLNNWHTNLNGVSIPEDDPQSMHEHEIQQERLEDENGWAVGGAAGHCLASFVSGTPTQSRTRDCHKWMLRSFGTFSDIASGPRHSPTGSSARITPLRRNCRFYWGARDSIPPGS